MNSEQVNRAFFGVVVFIAMGVYPPWTHSYVSTPDSTATNQPVLASQLVTDSAGYNWLWEPPSARGGVRPDMARLSIQWAGVVALFGLWVVAGRSRPTVAQPGKATGREAGHT